MRGQNVTSSRSARCINRRAAATVAVCLGLFVALPAPASAAIYEQAHEFFFEVANPTWDTTFQIPFDLPLFDDAGGTQSLLGYRLQIWGSYLDFTYTVGENPTPNYGAASGTAQTGFRMYGPAGVPALPHADPPYDEGFRSGTTEIRPPFYVGDPEPHHSIAPLMPPEPGFWDWEELNTDPALLAEVTGTGTLSMTAELILSDIDYHAPPDEEGMPEGWVYVPDMLEITPDLLHSYVVFTYIYTPEPTGLLLLCVGGLLLRPRRCW